MVAVDFGRALGGGLPDIGWLKSKGALTKNDCTEKEVIDSALNGTKGAKMSS